MQTYGVVGMSDLYAVATGLEHALPLGAVPVAEQRPAPGALLQPDGSWLTASVPPQPEPLDLNTITYDQANAIIRAESVQELRLAVLAVLGL